MDTNGMSMEAIHEMWAESGREQQFLWTGESTSADDLKTLKALEDIGRAIWVHDHRMLDADGELRRTIYDDDQEVRVLARAQVFATLAQAAATRLTAMAPVTSLQG